MMTSANTDLSGVQSQTGSRAFQASVLCIIILIITVGHTSLWIVVLRSRALRTVTNMFILGLSAADLLIATISMPLTVFTIIKGDWIFSDSLCMAFGFINMLTLVGSVLSLCNISINRYFMVCRPWKFKDIYTIRNAILMIITTVTTTILLSSLPLFGWSEYVYTPTHSFCFADWINYRSYAYFMISCCFGIPVSVMIFCNISIIKSVKASRRKVKSSFGTTLSTAAHSTNEDVAHKEQKINESDITDITKPKFESSSTGTNLSEVRDNIYIHVDKSVALEEINDSARSKFEKQQSGWSNNTDRVTQHGPNSDCVSDDPSNESKKAKPIVQPESAKQRQENDDNNLLYPQWKSKQDLDRAKETSVLTNTSIVSVKERKPLPQCKQSTMSISSDRVTRKEEIRLAVSLIVVVVLFVICWLPYCISMLISIHYTGYIPREFHMFTLLIGYANSGCNPIVYGLMNQRFKVGFKRLFCFWKSHVSTLSSNT